MLVVQGFQTQCPTVCVGGGPSRPVSPLTDETRSGHRMAVGLHYVGRDWASSSPTSRVIKQSRALCSEHL